MQFLPGKTKIGEAVLNCHHMIGSADTGQPNYCPMNAYRPFMRETSVEKMSFLDDLPAAHGVNGDFGERLAATACRPENHDVEEQRKLVSSDEGAVDSNFVVFYSAKSRFAFIPSCIDA